MSDLFWGRMVLWSAVMKFALWLYLEPHTAPRLYVGSIPNEPTTATTIVTNESYVTVKLTTAAPPPRAMSVPGGLGFSAHGHSQVVQKISCASGSAAVSVMVPNSLGPGELLLR